MNKFHTKTGWLTRYAMECGYIHITEKGPYERVSLASNNTELNTYEVSGFINGEHVWHVVDGIRVGRALYRKLTGGKPARRNRKSWEPQDVPETVYG